MGARTATISIGLALSSLLAAGCAVLADIPDRSFAPDASTSPSSSDVGLGGGDASPDGPSNESDFAITLGTQARVTLVRGSRTTVPITVAWTGGRRRGPTTITATGLPGGVTADPLTIAETTTSGVLTLRADSNASLTVTATLSVTGTAGPFAHTVTTPLFVQDPRGTLDTTFGSGGIFTLPIRGGWASAGIGSNGLALQPDGSIVICGNSLLIRGYAIVLTRLFSDGFLDLGFGIDGLELTYAPESSGVCNSVKVLPSGSLAIAGFDSVPNDPTNPHAFLAARFTDAGAIDPSFGTGGFLSFDIGGVDSKASDLVVEQDGTLVLGGFSGNSAALLGLSPAGTIGDSFGPGDGGTSSLGLGNITAIAPLPSGHFLAAVSGAQFGVAQFGPTGALGPASYGQNGLASAPAPTEADAPLLGPSGIAVQPGGKAVLAAYSGVETTAAGVVAGDVKLARFDAAGRLDATFGKDGIVTTSIPGDEATVSSIALTHDDGFAVGAAFADSHQFGVVRYDNSGTLDTNFAGVGYAMIPGYSYGDAVIIDPAGRIVVAAFTLDDFGDVTSVYGTSSIVVARFWP